MSAPAARARLSVRLWNSYLSALQVRPIRTRVITSSILFFTGDLIAQLVIEDRRLVEPDQRSTRGWDVSQDNIAWPDTHDLRSSTDCVVASSDSKDDRL